MRGERLLTANKIAHHHEKMMNSGTSVPRDINTGKFRKTRVFCSDPMCCGNPRRVHKITLKEKVAIEEYQDQILEVL